MANQVTLTFAGDDASLTSSFDRVGGAARNMSDQVGESASGFDRAGEAADIAEGRAQGFASTLTGTADIAGGTSEILKGNLFEGFVMVGGGAADLAEGFAYTLLPAMQGMVTWLRATTVGQYAAAAASKVWAAATWIANTALLANPITWIILAVVALIAIIVLIAVKTDWFSKAWRASWRWIKDAAASTWDFLKKIPGWIGSAFSRVADFISRPYRAAFNLIARAWNATVGRLSWTVPGWIPGIGGNTVSVPNLPTFHAGGRVPGAPGQDVLALLQAGETVSSAAGGGGGQLVITGDGSGFADALLEVLRHAVRVRGGNVQLVLGRDG